MESENEFMIRLLKHALEIIDPSFEKNTCNEENIKKQ